MQGKRPIRHCLKYIPILKEYCKARSDARLQAIASLFGTAFGVFASFLLAIFTINKQAQNSELLDGNLKKAEIAMALIHQLSECKEAIVMASTFKSWEFYRKSDDALLKCRTLIRPSLAGLKVLQNDLHNSGISNHLELLFIFDERLQQMSRSVRAEMRSVETFSSQIELTNRIASLIASSDSNEVTIKGLENLLTERPKASRMLGSLN